MDPTQIQDRGDGSPPKGLRVLIVDDQLEEAEGCARILQTKGHQTHFSITGREAIDRATYFSPELVLLDLGMEGMDGFEVIAELRQLEYSRPPVIAAVTGYESRYHRRLCAEAGFDQFVIKPVSSDAYDYLLWTASASAQVAESLFALPRERKGDFYAFAMGQLQFAHLILDFAEHRSLSLKLSGFAKVDRILDRTTIWLGRATGFTDFQMGMLRNLLNELRDRLIAMRFNAAVSPGG